MPRTATSTTTATTSLWRMVAAGITMTAMAIAMTTKTASAFRPAFVRTSTRSSAAAALFHRNPQGIPRNSISASFRSRSVRTCVSRNSGSRLFASVTGSVYEAGNTDSDKVAIVVTLYTKEGCTLCDKVKDVLKEVQQESDSDSNSDSGNHQYAHSLRQIDITDDDQTESYDRYKYDIPVLHIGYANTSANASTTSAYWTKHRLTVEEAKEAIAEAMGGSFEPRKGRPDAAAMER